MIEQRNLILAVAFSISILLAFQYFYEMPRLERLKRQQATEQIQPLAPAELGAQAPPALGAGAPPVPGAAMPPASVAETLRQAALEKGRRVPIRSARLHGSILLDGGRIDDLTLADYRATPDPQSPEIVLLSAGGVPEPYYAEFGWVAAPGTSPKLPDSKSEWRTEDEALTPESPLKMTWDNGEGLRFTRTISLDEGYLFTVTQRVESVGSEPFTLFSYGLISRTGTPDVSPFWFLHEGPAGVLNGKLEESDYDDLKDDGPVEMSSNGGWLGIKDQFWLVALVPSQDGELKARFTYDGEGGPGIDRYQVDYLHQGGRELAPGGTIEVTSHLFAGAKEMRLLERYAKELGAERFHMAIDYTKIYFLTFPLHKVLLYFVGLLGNYGLAILLLTVIVKLIFFPLANKSYKAMSRMKKLQPEVTKLRERVGDDRQRLNQEMMALYKKEKVNPLAGCLPIVIQLPVFFSLYIVLFVTIEMRHAPFFGWIRDLSAPDPLGVLTLFGLIQWEPTGWLVMLNIGIWPLLMGLSMFLQTKLNPQPADPMQARLFMLMPIFFTFLLATFPAGLVIYWTWNNVLSITQQWIIMRRAGVRI